MVCPDGHTILYLYQLLTFVSVPYYIYPSHTYHHIIINPHTHFECVWGQMEYIVLL